MALCARPPARPRIGRLARRRLDALIHARRTGARLGSDSLWSSEGLNPRSFKAAASPAPFHVRRIGIRSVAIHRPEMPQRLAAYAAAGIASASSCRATSQANYLECAPTAPTSRW